MGSESRKKCFSTDIICKEGRQKERKKGKKKDIIKVRVVCMCVCVKFIV